MTADDPELADLLVSYAELLEAMRWLATLTERLAARVELTAPESQDVTAELEATRALIDQLDAMLTLRRQYLRPM